MSKPKAVIFDVDGTLAFRCEREFWESEKAIDDSPNAPICNMMRLYSHSHTVIVVTGRWERDRAVTVEWLKRQGLRWHGLFLRGDLDQRQDDVVKREVYERYIAPYYDVEVVVEDRKRVVAMWRALGLCCLQVCEGDY